MITMKTLLVFSVFLFAGYCQEYHNIEEKQDGHDPTGEKHNRAYDYNIYNYRDVDYNLDYGRPVIHDYNIIDYFSQPEHPHRPLLHTKYGMYAMRNSNEEEKNDKEGSENKDKGGPGNKGKEEQEKKDKGVQGKNNKGGQEKKDKTQMRKENLRLNVLQNIGIIGEAFENKIMSDLVKNKTAKRGGSYQPIALLNNVYVTGNMFSVYKEPSGQLCTAFLIRTDVALTAASCVFGQDYKQLYLKHYIQNSNIPVTKYTLTDMEIHPMYDPSENIYNLAILYLSNNVTESARIYRPYLEDNVHEHVGEIYRWITLMNEDVENYYSANPIKLISNTACSLLIHKNINCDKICADFSEYQNQPYIKHPGQFDLGTPLVINYQDTQWVAGIYTGDYLDDNKPVQVFEQTKHMLPWLIRSLNAHETHLIV